MLSGLPGASRYTICIKLNQFELIGGWLCLSVVAVFGCDVLPYLSIYRYQVMAKSIIWCQEGFGDTVKGYGVKSWSV
jgi:hypothetical protein